MENYLSAGVFFVVTLGFLRPGKAKKSHLTDGDGLDDTDVMLALVKLIRGETDISFGKDLLRTPLSRFKTCEQNPRDYIPFNDKDLANSFHVRFLQRDKKLLYDSAAFLDSYIDPLKRQAYVKALLELVEIDDKFLFDKGLLSDNNQPFFPNEIQDGMSIDFNLFFLSFLDTLLLNRQENKKGKKLFSQICSKQGNSWKYTGNLGQKYVQNLSVILQDIQEPTEEESTESISVARLPSGPVEIIDGNVIIEGIAYKIPEALKPSTDLEQIEAPYLRALIEIYEEAEHSKIDIDNLPKRRQEHFKSQRKSFYAAYSLERTAEGIFGKAGLDEFDVLVADAFEGIEMILQNDYETGYKRLQDVLEKITNTTLDGSRLRWLTTLINNITKKGLCHMMVNKDLVSSWVDPYGNSE